MDIYAGSKREAVSLVRNENMMIRKLIFCICSMLMGIYANANECDCLANFNWVKETFEENDAGFEHVLAQKGQSSYEMHNEMIRVRVTDITDYDDCLDALKDWVRFFRTDHFRFTKTQEAIVKQSKTNIYKPINRQTSIQLENFKTYLTNKDRDDIEGIWRSDKNIVLVRKEGSEYVGSILESTEDRQKGQVFFTINDDLQGGTRYLTTNRPVQVKPVHYLGQNLLIIDQLLFERNYPEYPFSENTKEYQRIKTGGETFAYKRDKGTVYLRIHSFSYNRKAIDSVLNHLHEEIISTPNLIIDRKDCHGGQDNNFTSLIHSFYTNPIRTVTAEVYSTRKSNAMWDTLIADPEIDEEEKKAYRDIQELLNQHLGGYVNIFGEEVVTLDRAEVLPYPKHIGIIIHENNFSTAEQFILSAKQSRKVKFFGKKTGGALDVSNMVEAVSPTGDFLFEYCISRSLRIPEMAVDDMGIHPDFYLDRTIPEDQWVDVVQETLMGWK